MFLRDLQCLCTVFFEFYISNLCNIPDLVISIKLVTGSALVLIFFFFNTSLLSVKHADSLQYVFVCFRTLPRI